MSPKEIDALLSDPEALDRHLRRRLVELTNESSTVAIKAIELLLDADLGGDYDDEFADISLGELRDLRGRADKFIRDQAGKNGASAHE